MMPRLFRLSLLVFCLVVLASDAMQGQTTSCNFDYSKVMEYARVNDTSDLVLLSAHRGLWEYVPENSPEAIQQAVNNCIEMSEIDVRLTSDFQPALLHDWKVNRTTTGQGMIYKMPSATFQSFYLRDRSGAPTQEKVPTLDDILAEISATNEVLILDCKDVYSIKSIFETPDSTGKKIFDSNAFNSFSSYSVMKIVWNAIKKSPYASLLIQNRIIFKVRFPDLPASPTQVCQDFYGLDSCPANGPRLNVVAIWYYNDKSSTNPGTTDNPFYNNGVDVDPAKGELPPDVTTYLEYAKDGTDGGWFWWPEVVVKYPNDTLQPDLPQVSNPLTPTVVHEAGPGGSNVNVTGFLAANDWAEGTSTGWAICCSMRGYISPIVSSGDFLTTSNYTGDLSYMVDLQNFKWVSSDKVIDADRFLTAEGKRNLSYITSQ